MNTLALMKAKQERDEPVRQFAARLRGLAEACDLTVTCMCGLKVSEVDKLVRMSLIGVREVHHYAFRASFKAYAFHRFFVLGIFLGVNAVSLESYLWCPWQLWP